ncbi:probable serine/threonine-protein kinase DDB_G0282963 isoform X2 [Cotesia glomerata]|uniref:probable serine/threonine-protein kinase DDB_G0282963 isoform X2 n=1 Tax=Cotesia glomerata TaxID=32391 RepID=UPI001D01C931|nr:probable serine/threonine-protein kinase DDB_G0282963 isoform X2 [Cotesia glomerata]
MGFKIHNWFRRRRSKEEKSTGMVLTVTEDTPADMLAGSMELIVQLPRDHNTHAERVTVERSTAMMDLLVQIATAHKLAASSYTLQAIGEQGRILPHQPNTPIGALDALEVKLLPKQGTFIPRKTKQASQPFETTFRLQVHLPRNQLYVSRVSPKTNLGDILSEVCREKNLDKNKYELRHPGNHKEVLDLSLSLQDYQLQEVTLYAKQGQSLSSALSSQDIMVLQRQEERRRHQAKQSIFGFMFKKSSKESSSVSTESGSYGARSVSPARSDDTGRSISPLVAPVPTRPLRKRRPAPNPPSRQSASRENDVVNAKTNNKDCETTEDKLVITHSRNSSDSSGYHEASVLSDNPDSAGRMPETLPRRARPPSSKLEPRKLALTSQASKSLCNLAISSGGLSHANSNTSLSSTGIRKKRAAPQPPVSRPLSSAISSQALERIVDSEESLTSDMGVSKPPSDIAASETETHSKANSDIVVSSVSHTIKTSDFNFDSLPKRDLVKLSKDSSPIDRDAFEPVKKAPIPIEVSVVIEKKSSTPVEKVAVPPAPVPVEALCQENNYVEARVKRAGIAPIPKPRNKGPVVPKRVSSALSAKTASEVEQSLPTTNEDNDQESKIKNKSETEEEIKENYDPVTLNVAGVTSESSSALNSDLSSRSPDMEAAGRTKLDIESPWNALSSSNTPNKEQYHPFITTGTNLSLPMENLTHSTQPEEGEHCSQGTGKAGNESQTEIDRLLEKVSTTLASVIPSEERAKSSEIKPTDPEKISELNKTQDNLSPNNNNNNNNNNENSDAQNSTYNSQQDTSDYVSANGEDLSGTEWEYQLPDPPSAFRDETGSLDSYETITLRSVEAFKDPIAIDVDVVDKAIKKLDRVLDNFEDKKPESDNSLENKNVELRRNVITELESKIENGCLNQTNNPSVESRKSSIETSTPKVAPIENTLPNFTITTYARQKSLNIFDAKDSTPKNVNHADERIVKTFATLSRNINGNSISKFNNNNNKDFEVEKKLPDKEKEFSTNPVHRSKSYIVLTNNSKYREFKTIDVVDSSNNNNNNNMIKSTSVTNLNHNTCETNGTQEDTKPANYSKLLSNNPQDRGLQSVQLLKSILPQLKSTLDDNQSGENKTNDKSGQVKLNADDKSGENESPVRKSNPEEIKRYRYTGPPAISLGSWSERPRANVQIKMDTDYKFGANTNTSGNKTLVNLNSPSDNVGSNNCSNYVKTLPKSIKSNFDCNDSVVSVKRGDSKINAFSGGNNNNNINNNVNNEDSEFKRFNIAKLHTRTKDEDKPVVTNVELKKSHNDKPEFKVTDDDDNKIDTRPVNFKELTQAFGKVNLRSKNNSKYNSVNRYSDIFDGRSSVEAANNKNPIKVSAANGPFKPPTVNSNGLVKKYTSVVDIDHHLNGQKKFNNNNTITKLNGPATAPKGFKVQANKISQVPPPPTMPIITGVTLKNNNNCRARPLSMPVGKDSRDQLLESIRCFGRDKLRNVSTVS